MGRAKSTESKAARRRRPKPYYDHNGITIYHGDCLDVLPTLKDCSIDLVLTDPPYGHNQNDGDLAHMWEAALGLVKAGKAKAGKARPITNDGPEAAALVRFLFSAAKRLLKPGCCCCCCCCCCGGGGPGTSFAHWILWLSEQLLFKQAIVWDKGGLGMGWHYRRNYELILVGQKPGAACNWHGDHRVANVMHFPGIKPRATDHPTPKPLSLMRRFVELHSAPGECVLDPLMGAGTTLCAAKDAGRKAIGIEIEEKYCEMAVKRLNRAACAGFRRKLGM